MSTRRRNDADEKERTARSFLTRDNQKSYSTAEDGDVRHKVQRVETKPENLNGEDDSK